MEEEVRKKMPLITAAIVVLNVGIWLYLEITGDTQDTEFMLRHGAAYLPYILENGENWRLVSCMFLHFGADHLINNMLILALTGYRLELTLGSVRYAFLYLASGLCGSLLSLCGDMQTSDWAVSAGASGAVFGVIGGLLAWAIWHRGKVEGLTAKGLLGMAALSLYYGFTTAGVDNLGHIGGILGGFALGCIYAIFSKMIDFRKKNQYTID